jgi:hypothetical protein
MKSASKTRTQDTENSIHQLVMLGDVDHAHLMVRALIANNFDHGKAVDAMNRWREVNRKLAALAPSTYEMWCGEEAKAVHRDIASQWMALYQEREAALMPPVEKAKRSLTSIKAKSRVRTVKSLTKRRRTAEARAH